MYSSPAELLYTRRIKEIATEYFSLPDKAHIDFPDELLPLFLIHKSKHGKHPHDRFRVYISRKSLKHFVEARKKELLKNHSPEIAIQYICFAIDMTKETVINFDSSIKTNTRYAYSKTYTYIGMPQIRIIFDVFRDSLEICSIHFRTKNTP